MNVNLTIFPSGDYLPCGWSEFDSFAFLIVI